MAIAPGPGGVVARGRVLSVNVGQPAGSQWRGAAVTSAIVKRPVRGPVAVRGVNLAGDRQADLAVHGGPRKALYAYPSEHYLWWAAEFGVDPSAWGFVGENLTIAGITEDEVSFGDLLTVGTARLVVTEPRGPCYKLAMRVGADQAPVRMLQTGRTGFYLGVVSEGELQAGDEVVVSAGGVSPRVTIAELCSAFARPAEIDDARLDRLLELPGLDRDWREHFDHERQRRRAPARRAPVRHKLTVESTTQIAHDVLLIALASEDEIEAPEPGQFLPLLVSIDGTEHVRCYSVIDTAGPGKVRIAVRRSREDRAVSVSRWIHDTVTVGTEFAARDPAGAFTLAGTAQDRAVALIAGGIGITPMLPLARGLADQGRPFAMFVGVRDHNEVLFVEELRALAREPACRGVHLFHPGASGSDDGVLRCDRATVPIEAVTEALAPEDEFFICGPPAMQEAIVAGLERFGVDRPRIRVEYFGDGPSAAVDAPAQEVIFDRRSRVVLWSDPSSTLLDLALEHGIEIPYSCRSGSCGTCAVKVLAGAVGQVRAPAAPITSGSCLACISYPLESTVLDA